MEVDNENIDDSMLYVHVLVELWLVSLHCSLVEFVERSLDMYRVSEGVPTQREPSSLSVF